MAYDLTIWRTSRPVSYAEAQAELAALVDSDRELEPPHPELVAFIERLIKKYPADLPDERIDESPWSSSDFDPVDNRLDIAIVWSRVAEVAPYVIELAVSSGLACLDPQSGDVHLPAHLRKARVR